MTAPVLDVMQPETANALAPDLERDATALATQLVDCRITNLPELATAAVARDRIAALRKSVVDYFAPIKGMAYKLHRTICDRENAILKPLDARDRTVRDAMALFTRQQDEDRREREQAEQERRYREAQSRAVHEAASLETAGHAEIAAAIVEDAMVAPPPVVTLPDPVREMVKFRKVWKWRYAGTAADREKVLKLIPREFLAVDEVKVNSYVRSMKSSGSIPGIEIYSVDEPVR
jgi:hypothetical protein